MKTKFLTIPLLMVVTLALYLSLKPHKQDPHYFAAACVMLNDRGEPKNHDEFQASLKDVIINENSSYAFDKVTFDPTSGQGAGDRYYALSAEKKAQVLKGVDACLKVMLPENKHD